ncbi:hypothetical protein F2Q70_00026191 [Brassica cretica]|uniref:Uncharacterized protein n=1 Tax=Brassica cretica TaxID=69181 RepID=A0A8S9LGY3_BRACR|nr:hypothetical protein F2Q70_00026191 [Brassica cretica]
MAKIRWTRKKRTKQLKDITSPVKEVPEVEVEIPKSIEKENEEEANSAKNEAKENEDEVKEKEVNEDEFLLEIKALKTIRLSPFRKVATSHLKSIWSHSDSYLTRVCLYRFVVVSFCHFRLKEFPEVEVEIPKSIEKENEEEANSAKNEAKENEDEVNSDADEENENEVNPVENEENEQETNPVDNEVVENEEDTVEEEESSEEEEDKLG